MVTDWVFFVAVLLASLASGQGRSVFPPEQAHDSPPEALDQDAPRTFLPEILAPRSAVTYMSDIAVENETESSTHNPHDDKNINVRVKVDINQNIAHRYSCCWPRPTLKPHRPKTTTPATTRTAEKRSTSGEPSYLDDAATTPLKDIVYDYARSLEQSNEVDVVNGSSAEDCNDSDSQEGCP